MFLFPLVKCNYYYAFTFYFFGFSLISKTAECFLSSDSRGEMCFSKFRIKFGFSGLGWRVRCPITYGSFCLGGAAALDNSTFGPVLVLVYTGFFDFECWIDLGRFSPLSRLEEILGLTCIEKHFAAAAPLLPPFLISILWATPAFFFYLGFVFYLDPPLEDAKYSVYNSLSACFEFWILASMIFFR